MVSEVFVPLLPPVRLPHSNHYSVRTETLLFRVRLFDVTYKYVFLKLLRVEKNNKSRRFYIIWNNLNVIFGFVGSYHIATAYLLRSPSWRGRFWPEFVGAGEISSPCCTGNRTGSWECLRSRRSSRSCVCRTKTVQGCSWSPSRRSGANTESPLLSLPARFSLPLWWRCPGGWSGNLSISSSP